MRDIVIIFAVLLLLLVLISTLGGSIRYSVPAPRVIGSPYAAAAAFPESFAEQEKERDTFAEELPTPAADAAPAQAPKVPEDEGGEHSAAAPIEGFASRSSEYAMI